MATGSAWCGWWLRSPGSRPSPAIRPTKRRGWNGVCSRCEGPVGIEQSVATRCRSSSSWTAGQGLRGSPSCTRHIRAKGLVISVPTSGATRSDWPCRDSDECCLWRTRPRGSPVQAGIWLASSGSTPGTAKRFCGRSVPSWIGTLPRWPRYSPPSRSDETRPPAPTTSSGPPACRPRWPPSSGSLPSRRWPCWRLWT